ncbi:MAG: YdcF family protein [Oscillospiraceae bacterium]|nr:YdcF family protein [Oscillospiraceae bacterium]
MNGKTIKAKPIALSLSLLTAAALLALAGLVWMGYRAMLSWGNLILALYFGSAAAFLAAAFFRQLRCDLYSYNTIFYAGFSLFLLSISVTHLVAAAQAFLAPEDYRVAQMLYSLVHSAKNYMFLTSPLLFCFSAALMVSNLALIRHEGRRFVNLLGILLALALIAGEILIAYLDFRGAYSRREILLVNLTANLTAAFYLYFECMIVGAVAADWIAAKRVAAHDKDYLIVLGCGLKKDGAPTPLLCGRLDLALRFDREQRETDGRDASFIVSGGQGPDESRSEASSMRDYLLSRGVPADRILTEDRSTDTEENMRFSGELIGKQAPEARVAFFTTNYHVFRAGLKARQAGLPQADGMGAPTRWYFWPNAAVREFVGLLTEHRGTQALVLGTVTLAYALLTVLAYY